MILTSRAKINLTLDIMGKRPDGFHELRTVFQQVDLVDRIEFEPTPDGSVTLECDDPSLCGDDNLCCRAVRLMRELYQIREGARMRLVKNIPVGAGLSGGSGNAAAVLMAMRDRFAPSVGDDELMRAGATLGSDVPFHIIGGTCLGSGRGEILERLAPLPPYHAVIVYPGFPVSTREAYGALDYGRTGRAKSTDRFIESYDLSFMHNDFEYSLFPAHHELAELKKSLGPRSLLSGSGSCVFGLFAGREEAERTAAGLSRRYRSVFATGTSLG